MPFEKVGLALLSLFVLVYLALTAYVAEQARRRGYSFLLWLVAGVVSLNPFLVLIVLAVLPDARKMRLRAKELADIDRLLAARGAGSPARVAAPVRAQSLGDQSTVAPDAPRSLGDEETRA